MFIIIKTINGWSKVEPEIYKTETEAYEAIERKKESDRKKYDPRPTYKVHGLHGG